MAKWGSCDFKQLQELQKKLEKVERQRADFCEMCAKELAARLWTLAGKRTPVVTGELQRKWAMGVIQKQGVNYVIEVINPVEYASYVEYGHRQTPGRYVPALGKRLKKGWVPGHFMLTISEKEIQRAAPAILEKKLKKFLEDCLNAE